MPCQKLKDTNLNTSYFEDFVFLRISKIAWSNSIVSMPEKAMTYAMIGNSVPTAPTDTNDSTATISIGLAVNWIKNARTDPIARIPNEIG